MLIRFVCTSGSLVKEPTQLMAGRTYKIGRSSKCAFVLGERSVSRVHAELEFLESTLLVKDLESRNGTYVNGEKVEQARLKVGQSVYFGSVMFRLVKADAAPNSHDSELSRASTYIVPAKSKAAIANLRADLTSAQTRVLHWLIQGISCKEVADQLKLSEHTIHNHVKAIYKIFHVNSRAELLALLLSSEPES
jgi:DNA-binding CsgD family transcriptional regulator